jgi:hypothetical protein
MQFTEVWMAQRRRQAALRPDCEHPGDQREDPAGVLPQRPDVVDGEEHGIQDGYSAAEAVDPRQLMATEVEFLDHRADHAVDHERGRAKTTITTLAAYASRRPSETAVVILELQPGP